jgi:hypothetical protein
MRQLRREEINVSNFFKYINNFYFFVLTHHFICKLYRYIQQIVYWGKKDMFKYEGM